MKTGTLSPIYDFFCNRKRGIMINLLPFSKEGSQPGQSESIREGDIEISVFTVT
jgi:hypothetical protein